MVPGRETLSECPECRGNPDFVLDCIECDGLGVLVGQQQPRTIDPDNNPRLETLREHLILHNDPVIVWSRFTNDIEDILRLGKDLQRNPVRYDGKTSVEDKTYAKEHFQKGGSGLFVANQKAAGRGLRLSAAKAHYFYSNLHALLVREQCEDRTEDVNQTHSTTIIDIIANDTVDEVIIDTLRQKRRLSEVVMQENRGLWL